MKTIVMTGGTSGFGKVTVKRLMQLPNTRILLGVRRNGPEGVEILPLDLAKLENVRSFASEVCSRVGNDKIDALVFNAGLSLSGGSKTCVIPILLFEQYGISWEHLYSGHFYQK